MINDFAIVQAHYLFQQHLYWWRNREQLKAEDIHQFQLKNSFPWYQIFCTTIQVLQNQIACVSCSRSCYWACGFMKLVCLVGIRGCAFVSVRLPLMLSLVAVLNSLVPSRWTDKTLFTVSTCQMYIYVHTVCSVCHFNNLKLM